MPEGTNLLASNCYGWESHWRKTNNAAAYEGNATHANVLKRHWLSQIDAIELKNKSVLDLASGNGAVFDIFNNSRSFNMNQNCQYFSTDLSQSAMQHIQMKYKNCQAVRANLNNLPFIDDSFDVVTSQFGVEYAGLEAVNECCRVLKKEGKFIGVFHYRDGALHQECNNNVNAINELLTLNFFDEAHWVFGIKSPRNKVNSEKRFTDILASFFALTKKSPKAVSGMLLRLCNDVSYMYANMQNFESASVLQWLSNMEQETNSYLYRMKAMSESSLDIEKMKNIVDIYTDNGFKNTVCKSLSLKGEPPFAWTIRASA
jgi:ubiquinone/menaquinone biosynthesis C-methylase UbiE